MAYSEITEKGVEFITYVCTKGMEGSKIGTLLEGQQYYQLPFCKEPQASKVWTCDIKIPGTPTTMTSGNELAQALIYWFNYYSKMFDLDANVIAAQAYAESGYYMWNYAGGDSSASGVNEFKFITLYEVIIKNTYTDHDKFTDDEINKIINGVPEAVSKIPSTYTFNTPDAPSPPYKTAWENRPIIFQNIINNPDIMIKAQCILMSWLANQCNDLTSSTLFAYNRGTSFIGKTYTDCIQKCKKSTLTIKDPNYPQEGLNYVLKIFGILGDETNFLSSRGLIQYYKPLNEYFGYDDSKGNSPKNLRLKELFNKKTAEDVESNAKYSSILTK
jgi:hypothetical protein